MQRPWGSLLTGALLMACSPAFLQNPDHQPKDGTTHSELIPLTSSTKQEKDPKACPQVDLMEVFSQLAFPPLKYLQSATNNNTTQ